MKKDRDYSFYFFAITLWLMLNYMNSCESANELREIEHKLSIMETEVSTLKYYTH